jgi:cytochrome c oxidase cbb3-type subunit 3
MLALTVVALSCGEPSSKQVGLSGRSNGSTTFVAVGPTPGPALHVVPESNPFGQDPMTLNAGRLYFNRFNCSGCHGGRAGGGMGPSLRDAVWLFGNTDAQIFHSIAQGRGRGMPAWGEKLPDEVIWKLVAYIKSLRTPEEPDAPDQTIPKPPLL